MRGLWKLGWGLGVRWDGGHEQGEEAGGHEQVSWRAG